MLGWMRTVHLISYFEKNQGKYTLLGDLWERTHVPPKDPLSCTIWTMLSPTFLFCKVAKIHLSLLRGTPGAAPRREGKRFSSQMKGPCAWERRVSQDGLYGAGSRSEGVTGALETLLTASKKMPQQQPPTDRR